MQQIHALVNTFGDISGYILNQVMKYAAPKIFFVTNQYNKQSIKSFQRKNEQLLELSESQYLAETNQDRNS